MERSLTLCQPYSTVPTAQPSETERRAQTLKEAGGYGEAGQHLIHSK